MKMWKIVESKGGEFRTLFHGVNRSRKLPRGVWLKAEKKMVRDGSGQKRYLSGFHVLKTKAQCEEHLKNFRKRRHLIKCVECEVRGDLRVKPTNPNVYLADEIRFSGSTKKRSAKKSASSSRTKDRKGSPVRSRERLKKLRSQFVEDFPSPTIDNGSYYGPNKSRVVYYGENRQEANRALNRRDKILKIMDRINDELTKLGKETHTMKRRRK